MSHIYIYICIYIFLTLPIFYLLQDSYRSWGRLFSEYYSTFQVGALWDELYREGDGTGANVGT